MIGERGEKRESVEVLIPDRLGGQGRPPTASVEGAGDGGIQIQPLPVSKVFLSFGFPLLASLSRDQVRAQAVAVITCFLLLDRGLQAGSQDIGSEEKYACSGLFRVLSGTIEVREERRKAESGHWRS